MWCPNALNLTSQRLNVTSQCIQCINGISWKWRNTPLTGLWEADLFGLHRKKNWYPGPNIMGVQVFIPGFYLYTLRLQGVWNSTWVISLYILDWTWIATKQWNIKSKWCMLTYRTVVLHLSGLFTGEECWCGAEIEKKKCFYII